MKDGHLDVFIGLTSVPQASFIDLDFNPGVRFIGIEPDIMDQILKENPGYMSTVIPKSAYKSMTEDVSTLGVATVLVVNKDVPDDIVYNAMTTGLQGVAFDLTPNANTTVTVSLRVADAGDAILDTAALIDNLQIDGCQAVDIDIKFCSDPNGFNSRHTRGVVPLTIFGTARLDVNDIDLSSLKLCEAAVPANCTGAPVDSSIADRGDPDTDIGAAQCTIISGVEQDFLNPDGFDDLDVGFLASEVCGVIGCPLPKGTDSPTLILTGNLNGGEPFQSIPVDDNAIDQLAIKQGT
jgi:hypothetical protein